MWERLLGVQVSGWWATFQFVEICVAIVALGWLYNKIKSRGESPSQREGVK